MRYCCDLTYTLLIAHKDSRSTRRLNAEIKMAGDSAIGTRQLGSGAGSDILAASHRLPLKTAPRTLLPIWSNQNSEAAALQVRQAPHNHDSSRVIARIENSRLSSR
jgi:hypothetical protein